MEKQGLSNEQNNVIPFPDLTTRLLERGVQFLKDKNYQKAMELFEQLTQLEPEHAQACYGLAVCYVELEAYKKAENLTEGMMKKGIGDYFDVLKLHITILIQQHEYEKVVSTIQLVLSEASPPLNVKETLTHLEEFAKIRMEEGGGKEAASLKPHFSINIKQDLESPKAEQQWRGIQKGRTFVTEQVLEDYLSYLKSENGDPFLKSMVIKILIENGFEGPVTVFKFDKRFTVDLKESELFYEGFSKVVQNFLEHALESNNPSLLNVAIQVWDHFTVAVYPKPLEPNDPKVWAAASYVFAHHLSSLEWQQDDLMTIFEVTKEEVARPLSLMKSIEENRLFFLDQ